jgi:hypothetical protein
MDPDGGVGGGLIVLSGDPADPGPVPEGNIFYVFWLFLWAHLLVTYHLSLNTVVTSLFISVGAHRPGHMYHLNFHRSLHASIRPNPMKVTETLTSKLNNDSNCLLYNSDGQLSVGIRW